MPVTTRHEPLERSALHNTTSSHGVVSGLTTLLKTDTFGSGLGGTMNSQANEQWQLKELVQGSSDSIPSEQWRAAGNLIQPAEQDRNAPITQPLSDVPAASSGVEDSRFDVLREFARWRRNPDLAMAVAAIKALTAVITRSEAETLMGLEKELREASDELKAQHKTSISLSAGCDLFLRFVTRTVAEQDELAGAKARLIERGERFADISLRARRTIASLGQEFVADGSTILTHGFSRVVLAILREAAAKGRHFDVIVTEGRPDSSGLKMARELSSSGVPVTLVLDAAVGFIMERCDGVLVGADGVVESGGIMSILGTFQVAVVAKAMNKPVYVAAESYKFARMYPLDQRDWDIAPFPVHFPTSASSAPLPPSVKIVNTQRDYTPPQYLTLLFTDLGVLTPSAVSDELIQLYL